MTSPAVNLRGSVPHFYVRINGDLATEVMQNIHDITIESSLHMPDVATLTLRDLTPLVAGQAAYRFTDDQKGTFLNGNPLTISIRVEEHQEVNVFDGEIVEVEAQLLQHGQRLVVRAFDRLHRLSRGTHTRTFQNVTDMDVVKKIAAELGLKAKVGPASFVHDYVLQSNQTNLDFLRERALKLGYLLFVDGTTLCCLPMESMGHAGDLDWGVNLLEFTPRVSSLGQASGTTLRSWDPQRKRAVVSAAGKGRGEPEVAAAGEEDLAAPYTLTGHVVRQEKLAELYAGGSADQRRQGLVEATGVAGGYPKMTAGMTVKLGGVSDRYQGQYTLSSVTHHFRTGDQQTSSGYTTEFTVSGGRAPDIARTLAGAHQPKKQYGFVIGIVTNNEDPRNQGRVKVKFPWLSDKDESDWARVAVPGGGPGRGMEWLPEVDDEVLVGFELGDMHHPYVIGGLWNGVDAPPEPSRRVVKGGKTIRRVHYSRKGHRIVLDDSDDQPHILVEDMNGNVIRIDSKTNTLTIQMKGDVRVEAQGRMDLRAQDGIRIDGGAGAVDVKGSTINLN
ncbi:Rhs element Vgr protein [Deinococcus phoenicis]|uniref:Rhs element Vgr protein n=1 Tax=Deinococcus phoenicis TaxID=1476583 RepID=A0A016QM46_9DEIO|nr:VgrG-related protein [Deinococcus phoenicis]EYB66957.1 Rhs element Vgr protein [Deinococcus phoenicis]